MTFLVIGLRRSLAAGSPIESDLSVGIMETIICIPLWCLHGCARRQTTGTVKGRTLNKSDNRFVPRPSAANLQGWHEDPDVLG